MLSERDIEEAHPEAFDFAFGNLPRDKRTEFNRHLIGCRYCQTVVAEYADIGQIIKSLPPHVEPSPDLEEPTIAAMVAAMAEERAPTDRRSDDEDRAATRVYPIPEVHQPAEPETQVQPRPQLQPPAEDEASGRPPPVDQPAPAETAVRPVVTRLPVWRRYRGRLAAVVAVAAAIITAAIVVPLSLGGRTSAQLTVAISLHATDVAKRMGYADATGQATARQAGESWTFTLTVHGLKPLSGDDFYECWWVTPGHTRLLATGGSFVVGDSGSTTVPMTTGVDPTQRFSKMEITAEKPSKDGALNGPVLLTS